MLGEGEGLELLGVFFTFIIGLGIMVAFGRWWESQKKQVERLVQQNLKRFLKRIGECNGFKRAAAERNSRGQAL